MKEEGGAVPESNVAERLRKGHQICPSGVVSALGRNIFLAGWGLSFGEVPQSRDEQMEALKTRT